MGDASEFTARLDDLDFAVGHGTLAGEITMDQVYAHYQHEGISRFTGRPLVYHRGGKSHFLRDAMLDDADAHLQSLADHAITESGSELFTAMEHATSEVRKKAENDSPREFLNLMRSGAERVYDDGELAYERPPDVPRLSDADLHRQAQRRFGQPPDYGQHGGSPLL